MKKVTRTEGELVQNVAKAFAVLDTIPQYEAFLRDLCTLSELSAMNERIEVAQRIQSKETYRSISEKTGASTATVTRVAHWLHHGMGGYDAVLAKLTKNATGTH